MTSPLLAAAGGVVVAGLSALIAFLALRLAARHPRLMLGAVLGGTLLRLLLVAIVSVLLLLFADVHRAGYVTGLIAAYLVFLAVEVALVARGRWPRP